MPKKSASKKSDPVSSDLDLKPKASKAKKVDPMTAALSLTNSVVRNDITMIPFAVAQEKSQAYINQQNVDEKTLSDVIQAHNPELFKELFEPKDSYGNPIFYSLVSENNKRSTREQRVKLFNDVMKIFVVKVRNKRSDTPLQASTTNSFLRRFLAHLKMKYRVCMSLRDDFSFAGGLSGTIY